MPHISKDINDDLNKFQQAYLKVCENGKIKKFLGKKCASALRGNSNNNKNIPNKNYISHLAFPTQAENALNSKKESLNSLENSNISSYNED